MISLKFYVHLQFWTCFRLLNYYVINIRISLPVGNYVRMSLLHALEAEYSLPSENISLRFILV
jgi:hypothetical protein